MEYYFGMEEFNKYGDKVAKALAGKRISKRMDDSRRPGGLEYESDKLGIGLFDLLDCLEGMCYNGTAEEVDDSTYFVKDPKIKESFDYDDEGSDDFADEYQNRQSTLLAMDKNVRLANKCKNALGLSDDDTEKVQVVLDEASDENYSYQDIIETLKDELNLSKYELSILKRILI
jgi:hypothetical protein